MIIVEGVIEYQPYSYWLKYKGQKYHNNTRCKFEELCKEVAEQKLNRERRGGGARLRAAAAARRMARERTSPGR